MINPFNKFDPYLTVYRKDYISRPLNRGIPNKVEQEFKDPLREGFINYLVLKSDDKSALTDPQELADDYLERFKKKYDYLGARYYKNPINKKSLERSFLFDGRTVYQVDYCDLIKDLTAADELKRGTTLPDDYDIPFTTHRASYRDPTLLNKRALNVASPIKHPNNLDPSEKTRKIMHVHTECSEYQAVIGKFGKVILDDALHGKMVYPVCKKDRRK